jgi:hypothetical protein
MTANACLRGFPHLKRRLVICPPYDRYASDFGAREWQPICGTMCHSIQVCSTPRMTLPRLEHSYTPHKHSRVDGQDRHVSGSDKPVPRQRRMGERPYHLVNIYKNTVRFELQSGNLTVHELSDRHKTWCDFDDKYEPMHTAMSSSIGPCENGVGRR